MTSTDIYAILESKPHNPHYLKRYWKFIQSCDTIAGYSEKHHICPKAKDLFPEYASFKEHAWNGIRLTARQHFIAHWMLWKAYKSYSTNKAFLWMCNCIDKENSDTKRINIRITSTTYEKAKIEFSLNQSNMVNAKSLITGKCTWISKEEFYASKEFVGPAFGNTYKKTETMKIAASKPQSTQRAENSRKYVTKMNTTKIVCDLVTRKEYSKSSWGTHIKSLYDQDYIKTKAEKLSKYRMGKKRSQESIYKGKESNLKHKEEYRNRMLERNKWNVVSDLINRKVYSIANFYRYRMK